MAIGAGDAVEKFGSQAAVTNAGVSISNGAMSQLADTIAWQNSDDAPDADMLLECNFSAPPNVNGTVAIYARKLDVRLTFDENQPTLGNNERHFIGVFLVDAGSTSQVVTARVQLPNGKTAQDYEFYFKNSGGQNITSLQVFIRPIATGPAP